uniref:Uncharacterized protein n=1 Tax=uncultured euryarchaeote Alv-FOS1 TaxID=337892 RepID=Q3SAB0_9EURY|nr:hypothetical protein [uncultured euryarchaeote Alv-FOS1]
MCIGILFILCGFVPFSQGLWLVMSVVFRYALRHWFLFAGERVRTLSALIMRGM